jgi:hypothetical protein
MHYTGVVVFEEAEVGVLPRELVREVRELCDLEEVLLLHLPFIKSCLDDLTCAQEYPLILGLPDFLDEALFEPGVLVLHLMSELVPQCDLFAVHKREHHVQRVQELVERHLLQVLRGHRADIFEEGLLPKLGVVNLAEHPANLVDIVRTMLTLQQLQVAVPDALYELLVQLVTSTRLFLGIIVLFGE